MNKKGFSLVELLAVLVILGLLLLLISRTVTNTINDAKDKVAKKQEQSILNAAEMWSVDNSEKFDDIEEQRVSIGMDVVFVLDITGSMKNTVPGTDNKNRFDVMYEILNDTFVELLQYNDVRISVVLYRFNTCSTKNSSYAYAGDDLIILPLDHYTIIDPSKKIFNYDKNDKFNASDDNKLAGYKATISNLKASSGATINKTTPMIQCDWTYYQNALKLTYDVFKGVSASDAGSRVPAVIFMSDGEPNWYTGNWQAPFSNSSNRTSLSRIKKGSTSQYGVGNGANKQTALYTILSANYYSNLIEQKYTKYDLIFYTIGLGVKKNSLGEVILNPTQENIDNFSAKDAYKKSKTCKIPSTVTNYNAYVWLDYNNGASTSQRDNTDLKYCLNNKTWGSLSKDYSYSDKYYGGENMSVDELKQAFESFSHQVIEATKITQVCVSVEDLYNNGYLSKDDIKLADGTAASTYVIMNYDEKINQYSLVLAKTEKQIADCNTYYQNVNK